MNSMKKETESSPLYGAGSVLSLLDKQALLKDRLRRFADGATKLCNFNFKERL